MNMEPCYFCNTVDDSVMYCSLCDKWMCRTCRNNPVKRVVGAIKELIKKEG